jgi:hypothetical protein
MVELFVFGVLYARIAGRVTAGDDTAGPAVSPGGNRIIVLAFALIIATK